MYPGNLPPEIWSKIFDSVNDAQDWLNLRRAAPAFEGLVEDKVTVKLIPAVLPHVFEQMRKTATTLGEILELRLVCRQWDQLLDNILLQHHNAKDFFHLSSTQNFNNYDYDDHYDFVELDKMSSFLQKFEAHSRNPFVGSHVRFSFDAYHGDGGPPLVEYKSLVSRFLNKFGAHIKSQVVTDDYQRGTLDFGNLVRRLAEVVQATPNLESLKVISVGTLLEPEVANMAPYDIEQANPLPIISNLKSLAWHGFANWRSIGPLQNVVLRMCGNREALKDLETVGIPSESATFRNLESASVVLRSREEMSGLRSCVWPLLTRLTLTTFPGAQLFTIQNAFEYAQRFRDSLISLELKGPYRGPMEGAHFKPNLPHLKSLTLPKTIPLQVVASLKKLQNIVFCHPHPSYESWEEVVLILETNMAESDIWRVSSSKSLSSIELRYFGDQRGISKSYLRPLVTMP